MRTLVHLLHELTASRDLVWQKPLINMSVSQPNAAVYEELYELELSSTSSPHVHPYAITYRWRSETDKTNDFYREQAWSLTITSKSAKTEREYDYAKASGIAEEKVPAWLREFIKLSNAALPGKDREDIRLTFPEYGT